MVCMRNIGALLLALAAVPSITATPLVANEAGLVLRDNGGGLGALLGGDNSGSSDSGDDSSVSGGSAPSSPASASASPTASPTEKSTPTTSASPSPTHTSASPTSAGPTSTAAAPTSNSPTTEAPSTSSPTPTHTASLRVITDSAGAQSTVYDIETVITSNGAAFTSMYTSAFSAPTGTTDSTNNLQDQSKGPSKGVIVGAVVGSVGGVILIAALAAVGWRVWGKNRHRGDEDDGLMGDGVYGTSEIKSTSAGSNAISSSPFQNNLEQYHTPGRANPSANF